MLKNSPQKREFAEIEIAQSARSGSEMKHALALLLSLLAGSCAFRVPLPAAVQRAHVTMSEPEEAAPEEASAPPAESEYKAEAKAAAESSGGLFQAFSDGMAGKTDGPKDVRGQGGLNDQGYEPYTPGAADSPPDSPAFLFLLGGGALLALGLSGINLAG